MRWQRVFDIYGRFFEARFVFPTFANFIPERLEHPHESVNRTLMRLLRPVVARM